jgi:D-alanine--poly(phosphoribitol) ligase subunit 1
VASALAERFRAVVERYSDRAALVLDRDSRLTYGELDQLSNRVSRFLGARGVKKGDRVALRMEKSPLAYAAIVACWKTGAPYFFIDPKNPQLRVSKMLEQCEPRAVLSEAELEAAKGFEPSPKDPPSPIDGTAPAYIMFTSGSTGAPKGAVISHGNVLSFLDWVHPLFKFGCEDRFCNLNALYFDNSVFDIYASLFAGASLVPFDSDTVADPASIARRIRDTRCTVYFSVPTLLIYLQITGQATRENFASVGKVIFGGEGYPKPKLKALFDQLGGQASLFNVYGPTECTCICSSHRISAADFADPEGLAPLGMPVGKFAFHVLGEDQEPVAPGETGELFLGGPGVGLGYFNQPEETERAFVRGLYRTGDLVRVSPQDGNLHFVGRKDSQIKHLGYRIELEEVRHSLCAVPGVDEAAVFYRASEVVGAIIAVVATRAGLTEKELRAEAATRLPKYMVPERIHCLQSLP